MCGLRSSPKAWQDNLAEVLQRLSFVRLKSEPNVYTNAARDCYITAAESIFEAIQKQGLLKHIGHPEPGKPQQLLGRNIERFGNYCALGLQRSCINNMTEETGMTNCNRVTVPGIAHYKPTTEDEARLGHEQRKRYGQIAGKLQRLACTRPDIFYATKELARDLIAPTELPQKTVKQAPTTLPSRRQTLQVHHRTDNNTKSKHQQRPGSPRSCRC